MRKKVVEEPLSRVEKMAEGVTSELRTLAEGQDKLVTAVVQSMVHTSEAESEARRGEQRVALLIDAENTQASSLEKIIKEIQKYGVLSTKRIFADWTSPQSAQWRQRLQDHAIVPVQQFSNTTSGKSSSDAALIIDAMDLLHSGRYETFVIVSSDSDFTRLATRIREDGKFVVGIGKNFASKAFVNACDAFLDIDLLVPPTTTTTTTNTNGNKPSLVPMAIAAETPPGGGLFSSAPAPASAPTTPLPGPKRERALATDLATLADVVEKTTEKSGWAPLGMVGTMLRVRDPDFEPRALLEAQNTPIVKGGNTLSQLFRALPDYDYRVVKTTAEVRRKPSSRA